MSFRLEKLWYVGPGARPALDRLFFPKSKNRYEEKLEKLYLYANRSPFYYSIKKAVVAHGGKYNHHCLQFLLCEWRKVLSALGETEKKSNLKNYRPAA